MPDPPGSRRSSRRSSSPTSGSGRAGRRARRHLHADLEAGKLDGIHLAGQACRIPMPAAISTHGSRRARRSSASRRPSSARRSRTGRSTIDPDDRQAAYAKANDAIRDRRPDHPGGPGRVGRRVPRRRGRRRDVAARPRTVRRDGARRPAPARLADQAPSRRAVLRRRDGPDLGALVCAARRRAVRLRARRGVALPALARSCDPNNELTVWTCTLRKGVNSTTGRRSTATTCRELRRPVGRRAPAPRRPRGPVRPHGRAGSAGS